MEEKKRKQHFVWEAYLKGWAADGTRICVWSRQDGRLFQANTRDAAQKRDFYRLRDMSDMDMLYVEQIIARIAHPVARESARRWMATFSAPFLALKAHLASGQSDGETERGLDILINNLEENMHADLEGAMGPLLDALRAGDGRVFSNEESCATACLFLARQYLRTPTMLRRQLAAMDGLAPDFNIEAAWGLLRTVLADNIGAALYLARKSMRMTFLDALTTPLITGDQPVVNTRGTGTIDAPPTEFELYYPLLPERALLLTYGAPSPGIGQLRLTDEDASNYNLLIVRSAHSQLYGRTREDLARATGAA